MKKMLFIAVTLFFFGVAPHAFADGFIPLAPIPGLTQGVTADSAGLAAFFNNLYKYLIGLAAVLAVLMIVWEGLRIATNQDNVSILTDSKGKIYNAIFGLVLVLSPALVFSIINPSILNLSVNLPPLDTRSGSPQTQQTQYVQESVRAGSTRAINNGQIIGFQQDYYASPQTGTYCIQLKPEAVVDGKSYFCARDSNGCRQFFNDLCRENLTQVSCTDGQGSTPVQNPCVRY
ncbi:TPA: hypothetical protein DIV48_02295 [Candidatus Kaiserbacteria bacterium]|nr:MAG: hypothetical protein UY93_C0001G0025 [Parcubacteria group bacterium GW2011_GWA1_56_13]KKW46994.1 MAG: hypothetical protein UY97_C0001G0051 [Parcubacteria group bacterium GW2011_GWB1_57_6]HCR52458.1 hypothetical protein [Candidatus Kaiserbacteria bacterium]